MENKENESQLMKPRARGASLQNFGRPCVVNDVDYKTKEPRERKARFHVWGYRRFGGKDDGPTMHTVAIVELENGRVTTKLPDQITFVDRGDGDEQAHT